METSFPESGHCLAQLAAFAKRQAPINVLRINIYLQTTTRRIIGRVLPINIAESFRGVFKVAVMVLIRRIRRSLNTLIFAAGLPRQIVLFFWMRIRSRLMMVTLNT